VDEEDMKVSKLESQEVGMIPSEAENGTTSAPSTSEFIPIPHILNLANNWIGTQKRYSRCLDHGDNPTTRAYLHS
jgi:hypothetical protein